MLSVRTSPDELPYSLSISLWIFTEYYFSNYIILYLLLYIAYFRRFVEKVDGNYYTYLRIYLLFSSSLSISLWIFLNCYYLLLCIAYFRSIVEKVVNYYTYLRIYIYLYYVLHIFEALWTKVWKKCMEKVGRNYYTYLRIYLLFLSSLSIFLWIFPYYKFIIYLL